MGEGWVRREEMVRLEVCSAGRDYQRRKEEIEETLAETISRRAGIDLVKRGSCGVRRREGKIESNKESMNEKMKSRPEGTKGGGRGGGNGGSGGGKGEYERKDKKE